MTTLYALSNVGHTDNVSSHLYTAYVKYFQIVKTEVYNVNPLLVSLFLLKTSHGRFQCVTGGLIPH